jgi:hypothetical protein
MAEKRQLTKGIQRLVRKYKQAFRISENLRHYGQEDYLQAEKRYVVYRLKNG